MQVFQNCNELENVSRRFEEKRSKMFSLEKKHHTFNTKAWHHIYNTFPLCNRNGAPLMRNSKASVFSVYWLTDCLIYWTNDLDTTEFQVRLASRVSGTVGNLRMVVGFLPSQCRTSSYWWNIFFSTSYNDRNISFLIFHFFYYSPFVKVIRYRPN